MSEKPQGKRSRSKNRPERLDPADERVRLRLGLISLYLNDRGFKQALRRLAKSRGNIATFCQRWGLTFDDDQVEAGVRRWCNYHQEANNLFPVDLIACLPWSGFYPPDAGVIHLNFTWDPTSEPRTDAEARLRRGMERQIQAALDDIAEGYRRFPEPARKRSTRRAQHLKWLYQRQRFMRSYAAIAKADPSVVEMEAVRQACRRLASEMGLRLRQSSHPRE